MHTDFPELFAERTRVYGLGPKGERRELHIESFWPHKGRVVFKLQGVDSIEAAQQLVGWEVQIPFEQRAPLQEGAVYVSDLVGCEVIAAGRALGKVAEVDFSTGTAPLLVVRDGKTEHLVPFAEEFVERIDVVAKRLELKLPEGLLEIEAPLSNEEKARHRTED